MRICSCISWVVLALALAAGVVACSGRLTTVPVRDQSGAQRRTPLSIARATGACARILFNPAPHEPFVENAGGTLSTQAFKIVGPLAETFVATPEDSNGNPIAGIEVTVTSSLPNLFSIQEVNDTTGENTFRFTPRSGLTNLSNPEHIQLVASGCPTSRPIAMYAASSVYVTDWNAVHNSVVRVYDDYGKPIAVPGRFGGLSGFGPGQSYPLIFDSHNRRLYVLNGVSTVNAFTLNGYPVQLSGSFPNLCASVSMTFDRQNLTLYVGDLYCSSSAQQATIYAFDENGNPVSESGGFPGAWRGVWGLTWDSSNGWIYAATARNCGATSAIIIYLPNGSANGGGQFEGSCSAYTIAYAPAANHFLLGTSSGIAVFASDGTRLAASYPGLNGVTYIAVDPITNDSYIASGSRVLKYSPTGSNITPAGSFPGTISPFGVVVVPP